VGIVVAGFDIHRTQMTFDALDTGTGEVTSGRIASNSEAVIGWVGRFAGPEVHVAVEACTGWYLVVRALECAGRCLIWRRWPTRTRCGAQAARQDRPRRRAGCGRCFRRRGAGVREAAPAQAQVVGMVGGCSAGTPTAPPHDRATDRLLDTWRRSGSTEVSPSLMGVCAQRLCPRVKAF